MTLRKAAGRTGVVSAIGAAVPERKEPITVYGQVHGARGPRMKHRIRARWTTP